MEKGDVVPSTMTDIEQSEGKLEKSLQKGGKP